MIVPTLCVNLPAIRRNNHTCSSHRRGRRGGGKYRRLETIEGTISQQTPPKNVFNLRTVNLTGECLGISKMEEGYKIMICLLFNIYEGLYGFKNE